MGRRTVLNTTTTNIVNMVGWPILITITMVTLRLELSAHALQATLLLIILLGAWAAYQIATPPVSSTTPSTGILMPTSVTMPTAQSAHQYTPTTAQIFPRFQTSQMLTTAQVAITATTLARLAL